MNILRNFIPPLLNISILILFSKCNLTTTKVKEPIFTENETSVARLVSGLLSTKEVNLNGIETNSGGKLKTQLTINLMNPKNIPTDTSESNLICERVATLVKHALMDTNAFMFYKVNFFHKQIDGALTSIYTGKIYKSEEIKSNFHILTLGESFDSLNEQASGKTTLTRKDSEIVSVLQYYDRSPGLPIMLKVYKQTDSAEILFIMRDQGRLEPGFNYISNRLKVDEFYKEPKLDSGTYRVEYLVGDSVVGTKTFKLL